MSAISQTVEDRRVGVALGKVLEEAPAIGVEDALRQYGEELPPDVRAQVLDLTAAELAQLANVSNALGGFDPVAPDNINNI